PPKETDCANDPNRRTPFGPSLASDWSSTELDPSPNILLHTWFPPASSRATKMALLAPEVVRAPPPQFTGPLNDPPTNMPPAPSGAMKCTLLLAPDVPSPLLHSGWPEESNLARKSPPILIGPPPRSIGCCCWKSPPTATFPASSIATARPTASW